jgi:hypothetical protein
MAQENYQEAMKKLEDRLNKDLGFSWWKKYIAAAFWSNISTPVNLAITVLTALTTGQATTNNLLSQRAYVNISIATLLLSVINTFFRPHDQSATMVKIMNKFQSFGSNFEEIYYTDNNDLNDYKRRFDAYTTLQSAINAYKNQDSSPESQNFLSDFIHMVARFTLLQKREEWIYGLDDYRITEITENTSQPQPHVIIETSEENPNMNIRVLVNDQELQTQTQINNLRTN